MPDPEVGKTFKCEVCLDEERLSDSMTATKVMVPCTPVFIPTLKSAVALLLVIATNTLTLLINLHHQLHLRCTLVSKSSQCQL